MLLARPPLSFAVLSADATLGEAFNFLLAGFAVVMLTLLALAAVCAAVGFLFRRFPALAGAAKPQPIKRRPTPAENAAADPAVLAAIGAAVDQALGGRYRVTRVKPVGRR